MLLNRFEDLCNSYKAPLNQDKKNVAFLMSLYVGYCKTVWDSHLSFNFPTVPG